jgi:hypothetical protein
MLGPCIAQPAAPHACPPRPGAGRRHAPAVRAAAGSRLRPRRPCAARAAPSTRSATLPPPHTHTHKQYGDGSVDYSKADSFSCPAKIVAPGSAAAADATPTGTLLRTIVRKAVKSVPIPGRPEREPLKSSVDTAFVAQLAAEAAATAAAAKASP